MLGSVVPEDELIRSEKEYTEMHLDTPAVAKYSPMQSNSMLEMMLVEPLGAAGGRRTALSRKRVKRVNVASVSMNVPNPDLPLCCWSGAPSTACGSTEPNPSDLADVYTCSRSSTAPAMRCFAALRLTPVPMPTAEPSWSAPAPEPCAAMAEPPKMAAAPGESRSRCILRSVSKRLRCSWTTWMSAERKSSSRRSCCASESFSSRVRCRKSRSTLSLASVASCLRRSSCTISAPTSWRTSCRSSLASSESARRSRAAGSSISPSSRSPSALESCVRA
mmetsp:Transcript_9892/g.40878  ORF Transcript_9892/g.40878 Transcript_9892/m.40878 type:complete len:277 (-) Transcript_9892:374-1204(-)